MVQKAGERMKLQRQNARFMGDDSDESDHPSQLTPF